MTLVVSLDADHAVAKLRALDAGIGEREILKAIGLRHLSYTMAQFRTQGKDTGGWKPLRPNTIAGRRKGRGPARDGAKILQNTGALRQSFVSRVLAGLVWVGTRNQIAEYHQHGTRPYTIRPTRAKRLRFMTTAGLRTASVVHHPGLPARPMIPDRNTGHRLAVSIVDAKLREAVKNAGA